MGCVESLFKKVKYEKVNEDMEKEIEVSEAEIQKYKREITLINSQISQLKSQAKVKNGKRCPNETQKKEMKDLIHARNVADKKLMDEIEIKNSFANKKNSLSNYVRKQKLLDSMDDYRKIMKIDIRTMEKKTDEILDNEGVFSDAVECVDEVLRNKVDTSSYIYNDEEEEERMAWNSDSEEQNDPWRRAQIFGKRTNKSGKQTNKKQPEVDAAISLKESSELYVKGDDTVPVVKPTV